MATLRWGYSALNQVAGTKPKTHAEWAALSGLTPAQSFSLNDHKRKTYLTATGASANLSLSDLARLYKLQVG